MRLKKLDINTAGVFFLRFLGVFLGFMLNLLLARQVEKAQLGLYFWLIQVLLVLSVVMRRGVDTSLLKYSHTTSRKELRGIIRTYVVSSILPVYAFGCVALTVASYIGSRYSQFIYFWLLCLLPFTLFNLISEYFKGVDRQYIATLIQSCMLPVLIASVFLFSLDIQFSYVVSVAVLCAISLFAFMKVDSANVTKDSNVAAEFWADSNTFLVIGLLNVVMNSLDILMLGIMSDNTSVAEYGIASKLVGVSSIVLIVANGILGPRFSRLWKSGELATLRKYYLRSTAMMAGLALGILVTMVLFGSYILEYLYGAQYLNSYELLVVLSIGQAIVLGTGPVAYLLMMTGSKNIHKWSLVLAVIVNAVLNVVLIPKYGPIGAAVATAASLALKNILSFCLLFLKSDFLAWGNREGISGR